MPGSIGRVAPFDPAAFALVVMTELFGIPLPALLSQLLLGLVNGSFYAILSLGLAVIFGLLNVINFAHGALYMMGAMFAWMGLTYFGLNYWVMLIVAPLLVGVFGVIIERLLLRHLYKLDHLSGLLLTFGLTLLIEGFFRSFYGVSGLQYQVPEQLTGARNLGFMILPNYRAWVVVASLIVCFGTWYVIERTKLGALLRAGLQDEGEEDRQLEADPGVHHPPQRPALRGARVRHRQNLNRSSARKVRGSPGKWPLCAEKPEAA